MWMTRTAINNPVFATMVMVALLVVGLFSAAQLGAEAMPEVKFPFVVVTIPYPGASPEQVENDISKPVETALNGIAGVKEISSRASEAQGFTTVQFRDGTDVNRAVQDVRDRIAQMRASLPREAREPIILRADTENEQPVVVVTLSSASRSQRDITVMAEQVVKRGLERAQGVGTVQVWGTVSREIQVRVDPARLAAHGLTIDQVDAALRAENTSSPVGLVRDAHSEAIIRVDGRIHSPADFDRIVVARRGTSVVRLGEVASTFDAEHEPDSLSRIDGLAAVSLSVFKTQDANVVSTGKAVRAAMKDISAQLPEDVKLKPLYDQSEWVESSIGNVRQTIFEGGLLTVIIVLLFLGSWRSTVITGLTLPISVIATLSAVYALGFTLNFMTLMALSLCIGLLIDDAIVVRENIVRHIHMGKPARAAALEGTEEVGLAVLATTLTIVAVFAPIAFMKGMLGKFFYPFGITVAVSVLLSLFVSFTLDPMLSSVWHDPVRASGGRGWFHRLLDGFDRGYAAVQSVYERLLSAALDHRRATLVSAVAAFVVGLGLFAVVGGEFVPEADQSFLSLKLTMPVGSSLAYSNERVSLVEQRLKAFPEIESIDTQVGTDEGRNDARLNLQLKPRSERKRSQKQVEAAIREDLGNMAGARLSVGFNTPIFVNLVGNNDADLTRVMNEFKAKVEKIPGIRDVQTSLKDGTPALSVRLKSDLAGEIGLTHAQVGTSLSAMFGGRVSGYWPAPDGQNYEVVILIPNNLRTNSADVGALELSTGRQLADGAPEVLPLRAIADVVPVPNPENIRRRNLQRRVALFASVEGRPAGDVGKDVAKISESMQLPPGMHFDINGDFEQMQDSLMAMFSALFLAVIFIYIVLASQFASFIQPLAIMASLPLSIVGVNLALLLTGTTLNIFSMIGIIFLMGLVTKNAILLVDFANRGVAQGLALREAIIQAGRIRLRPILMTTAAMVFGMIPLSLGLGEGAELQAPMGRAIIGGVLTSTLLTLVVVPVIYSYIAGGEQRRRERRAQRRAAAAAADPVGAGVSATVGAAVGSAEPAAPPATP